MIVRKQDDGSLMLVAQTEHSRMVGQFAAHWGNPAGNGREPGGPAFAPPGRWESTVRAAVYHDYGWLRYETEPMLDADSGETPDFLHVPPLDKQFASYQCAWTGWPRSTRTPGCSPACTAPACGVRATAPSPTR